MGPAILLDPPSARTGALQHIDIPWPVNVRLELRYSIETCVFSWHLQLIPSLCLPREGPARVCKQPGCVSHAQLFLSQLRDDHRDVYCCILLSQTLRGHFWRCGCRPRSHPWQRDWRSINSWQGRSWPTGQLKRTRSAGQWRRQCVGVLDQNKLRSGAVAARLLRQTEVTQETERQRQRGDVSPVAVPLLSCGIHTDARIIGATTPRLFIQSGHSESLKIVSRMQRLLT